MNTNAEKASPAQPSSLLIFFITLMMHIHTNSDNVLLGRDGKEDELQGHFHWENNGVLYRIMMSLTLRR